MELALFSSSSIIPNLGTFLGLGALYLAKISNGLFVLGRGAGKVHLTVIASNKIKVVGVSWVGNCLEHSICKVTYWPWR